MHQCSESDHTLPDGKPALQNRSSVIPGVSTFNTIQIHLTLAHGGISWFCVKGVVPDAFRV